MISNNIQTTFSDNSNFLKNLDILKSSSKNMLLFGTVGNGKTSILNKLTGNSFLTADRGFSCTRDPQFAPSLRNNFFVVDFPGMNAQIDILKHLGRIKTTLNLIPFKMVCFVVKWTTRYDTSVKEILQYKKIFREHLDNVTIIISHSESADITSKAELEMVIKERCKMKNLIFTEKKTPEESLSDTLAKFMSGMNNVQEAIVLEKDFLKDIEGEENPDVLKLKEKFASRLDLVLRSHYQEFELVKNNPGKKDLIRVLYYSIKNYKDSLVMQYKVELEKILKEVEDVIIEIILFQNEFYKKIGDFRKKCQDKIEVQVINYAGKMNTYRKCPMCGLIWFRVYGCDSIKCGKRSISKDQYNGVFAEFEILITEFFGIKVVERKRESSQFTEREFFGLTPEEQADNEKITHGTSKKALRRYEGCGADLKWETMEDVTNYVITQLKQIETSDYYTDYENEKNKTSAKEK